MKCHSIRLSIAGLLTTLLSMAAIADVNILYHDPPGGWSYSYLGEGDTWGGTQEDLPDEDLPFSSLDGTWHTQNGLEHWDHGPWGEDPFGGEFDPNYGRIGQSIYAGTPEDPLPNDPSLWGPAPGGVLAVNDNGTTYLRVQDTGDPEFTYGWKHTEYTNTNKKFCFIHDISNGGWENMSVLLDGVTLSFRARISTAAADPDAPLDDRYPSQWTEAPPPWGMEPAVPVTWAAGGDGDMISHHGNGHFGVAQSAYSESLGYDYQWGVQIGFSLALNSDLDEYGAGGLGSGLIMNNNQGDLIVDGMETNPSSNNIYPIAEEDLIEWREFWITIEENDSTPGNGTHTVNIYMDGSETPMTFHVTGSRMSGAIGDWALSYLQMAHSRMWNSSAIDIDFFSYKEGVHAPASAGVPGDFDGDGDVDGGDFLVWQRGESPNPLSGSDLAAWQANFGNTGGSLATAAVPEPAASTMVILVLAAFGWICVGRKGK